MVLFAILSGQILKKWTLSLLAREVLDGSLALKLLMRLVLFLIYFDCLNNLLFNFFSLCT